MSGILRSLWGSCFSLAASAGIAYGCSTSGGSGPSGTSNTFLSCERDSACGELQCICGACTKSCSGNSDCGGLGPKAVCVTASAERTALCTPSAVPAKGFCAPTCRSSSDCEAGHPCLAGVCSPHAASTDASTADSGGGSGAGGRPGSAGAGGTAPMQRDAGRDATNDGGEGGQGGGTATPEVGPDATRSEERR